MPKVYVSVVYYNTLSIHGANVIEKSLASLQQQTGVNLLLDLCDNASSDETYECLTNFELPLRRNTKNLGFSGAHNQAVQKFLASDSDYFLFFNPDLSLEPDAMNNLAEALGQDSQAGLACARLYRGDEHLEYAEPQSLDSAGVYLSNSLRHFDRGSNEVDCGQYSKNEYVFGGTGACLMLKRQAIQDLLLPFNPPELLDDAFFAYREDADLCWRAQHFGWKCLYVANAQGIHKRVVLPERRKSLNPKLNYYGVRNRFLLQMNNYFPSKMPQAILPGLIFRNLIVIFAVLLVERSSLGALKEVLKLSSRAMQIRKFIKEKISGI